MLISSTTTLRTPKLVVCLCSEIMLHQFKFWPKIVVVVDMWSLAQFDGAFVNDVAYKDLVEIRGYQYVI